jgi:hypothetical protein
LTGLALSSKLGSVARRGEGLKLLTVAATLLSCGGKSLSSRDAGTGGTGGMVDGGNGGTGAIVTDAGAGTDGAANTIPFTGGVYMVGTTSPGSCGADAVERIWPSPATVYYYGFDCLAYWFQFRPTDNQLFYQDDAMGVFMDVAGSTDTLIQTPPCGNAVARVIAFDGQGRLYYQCSYQVLRGNGELVADNVQLLAGALGDGRAIVTRQISTPSSFRFEVVGPGGTTVSVLDADALLGGISAAFPTATTTVGNDGFVMIQKLDGPSPEVVIFHLDAQSRFTQVRRFPVEEIKTWSLVISDGTVLMSGYTTDGTAFHIIAYPPNSNAPIEIWRDGASHVVHEDGAVQLLVGPFDATGPSVRLE